LIWTHHILPSAIIIQKVAFNIINKSDLLNNAFYKSNIFLGLIVLVDFLVGSIIVDLDGFSIIDSDGFSISGLDIFS
jgi:hypothetical protein